MKLRKSLLTTAGAIVVLLVATIAPVSAKSVSQVPGSCSAGTAGYGIFLQQGNVVTLGFGANAAGTWHIRIGEAGNPPILDYTASLGQQWTVSTNATMSSGSHVVTVNVDNLNTGEVCTSGMSFLVGGGGGGGTTTQPDLQLNASSSTGTPAPGAAYSYTFQVRNNGTATALGVYFLDILPVELPPASFGGVTTSDGSVCTVTPLDVQLQVNCDLGDMAVGAQKSVTIVVTAPLTSGLTYANGAVSYPSSVTSDKSLSNNSKSVSVTVR